MVILSLDVERLSLLMVYMIYVGTLYKVIIPLCNRIEQTMCKLLIFQYYKLLANLVSTKTNLVLFPRKFPFKYWGSPYFKATEMSAETNDTRFTNKSTMIFMMVKQCVNRFWGLCKPKSGVCKLFWDIFKPEFFDNLEVLCSILYVKHPIFVCSLRATRFWFNRVK